MSNATLAEIAREYVVEENSGFDMYMDAINHGNWEMAEAVYDACPNLRERFDTARCVLCKYMKHMEDYIDELEIDVSHLINFIELPHMPNKDSGHYNALKRARIHLNTLGVNYEG